MWASLVCQPFLSVSTEQLPYLKCPLHTVLKLTPVAYGKEASCTLIWLPGSGFPWGSVNFLQIPENSIRGSFLFCPLHCLSQFTFF